jgi:hypothetical protein
MDKKRTLIVLNDQHLLVLANTMPFHDRWKGRVAVML